MPFQEHFTCAAFIVDGAAVCWTVAIWLVSSACVFAAILSALRTGEITTDNQWFPLWMRCVLVIGGFATVVVFYALLLIVNVKWIVFIKVPEIFREFAKTNPQDYTNGNGV